MVFAEGPFPLALVPSHLCPRLVFHPLVYFGWNVSSINCWQKKWEIGIRDPLTMMIQIHFQYLHSGRLFTLNKGNHIGACGNLWYPPRSRFWFVLGLVTGNFPCSFRFGVGCFGCGFSTEVISKALAPFWVDSCFFNFDRSDTFIFGFGFGFDFVTSSIPDSEMDENHENESSSHISQKRGPTHQYQHCKVRRSGCLGVPSSSLVQGSTTTMTKRKRIDGILSTTVE